MSELEREARDKLQSLLDDLRRLGENPHVISYRPEEGMSVEEIRGRVARVIARDGRRIALVPVGQEVASFPQTQLEQLLEALLAFLGLHPQERAFVRVLAENRTDDATLAVFADWLEERGQDEAGRRVRLLRPQKGDVLAMWGSDNTKAEFGHLEAAAMHLSRNLDGGLMTLLLRPGQDVRLLPPSQMREAGWVRVEESQAQQQEPEECELVRSDASGFTLLRRPAETNP